MVSDGHFKLLIAFEVQQRVEVNIINIEVIIYFKVKSNTNSSLLSV